MSPRIQTWTGGKTHGLRIARAGTDRQAGYSLRKVKKVEAYENVCPEITNMDVKDGKRDWT
jgi:hypothetical protein